MTLLLFDPDARLEFLAVVRHYNNCQPGLGHRFRLVVETAAVKISVPYGHYKIADIFAHQNHSFLDALLFFMVDMPKRVFLTVKRKADSAFFPSGLGHPESNFLSPITYRGSDCEEF